MSKQGPDKLNKDGLGMELKSTRGDDPPSDATQAHAAADQSTPTERPDFRFNVRDLPDETSPDKRRHPQELKRKKPDAQGNTTIRQLSQQDLDKPSATINRTMILCPNCKVLCESSKSADLFTLFVCPVLGCNFTQKKAKPSVRAMLMRSYPQGDFSARP